MKYSIQNLDEITDSREILASKPHNFMIIFIYLTIGIVFAAITWAYFSEKEVVVKANGVVRPADSITKVSNAIVGKVSSVNYKDGDTIKKGQILYVIDHSSLDIQKASYEKSLKQQTTELNNLNKFKQSMSKNTNLFDYNNSNEKSYYTKFVKYQQDCNNIVTQQNSVTTQIQDLQNAVTNYSLLQKSISDNRNYFTNASSSYYNMFVDYQINVTQYQSKVDLAQKTLNTLKSKSADQSQIDAATADLNNCTQELSKYKNQYLGSARSNLEQNQQKLKELQSSQAVSQNSNSANMTKEQYILNSIIQTDEGIKAAQDKIDQINPSLKDVNNNINYCIVKSDLDGKINSELNINKGDILQSGTEIATILSNNISSFNVDIYINTKDIGELKIGQGANLNLAALPSSEYGTIHSKLKSISVDAKTSSQTGLSYYTATSTINRPYLKSHKGEKEEIRPGMTCQVSIVTRKESVFHYVVKKLGLSNK